MSASHAIELSDVQAAYRRVQDAVHFTPVMTCHGIETATKKDALYFKVEALQRTGSFKFRGACNAVAALSEADRAAGVCTHSSGNHGAALAAAARAAGAKCAVVVPTNAPAVKVEAMKSYEAEMIMCAPDARAATADELVKERSMTFVHPSNDPFVMAGQGTLALELLAQLYVMATC